MSKHSLNKTPKWNEYRKPKIKFLVTKIYFKVQISNH